MDVLSHVLVLQQLVLDPSVLGRVDCCESVLVDDVIETSHRVVQGTSHMLCQVCLAPHIL